MALENLDPSAHIAYRESFTQLCEKNRGLVMLTREQEEISARQEIVRGEIEAARLNLSCLRKNHEIRCIREEGRVEGERLGEGERKKQKEKREEAREQEESKKPKRKKKTKQQKIEEQQKREAHAVRAATAPTKKKTKEMITEAERASRKRQSELAKFKNAEKKEAEKKQLAIEGDE